MSERGRGVLALVLLTLIWGSSFAVIRGAVAGFPPSLLVFLRFLVAFFFFLPWLRGGAVALAGLELGLWLALGYGTQAVGLLYTTAGRSAFITALSVVLVPIFTGLLGQRVPRRVWVGAILALLGVGLLTFDAAPPNVGDLWTLLTAVTYAVFILRLEHYLGRVPVSILSAAQVGGMLLWSGLWVLVERPSVGAVPWGAVLYLGVVATALTTWLMTYGQKRVRAAEAAVLYALEPVWAALFAYFLLGERLGLQGAMGAVLVFLATLKSQLSR